MDVKQLNDMCANNLPGYLGIEVTLCNEGTVTAHIDVMPHHLAPNGYLHAGTAVTLADTCCGNGCIASLPKGAIGFTTIELKSNHLGTAREGRIECTATVAHMGRTTQVWDAEVRNVQTGKVISLFRCTQMILYPKPL
jgi:1,4-dihydroxy-2-naphthoyl-CoA hydrolase